jgi:hypothetical protein
LGTQNSLGTPPTRGQRPGVAVWLALLVAPSLMLSNLSLMYALSALACESRVPVLLHAACVASAILTMLFALGAAREWLRTRHHHVDFLVLPPVKPGFLAAVATAVGSLSALTIIAQWAAIWIVPHCMA